MAHISDLHVFDLDGVRLTDFFNKRMTGAATMLKRRKRHLKEILESLIEDIVALDVDHVAVTGDISNLSLHGEFRTAVEMLQSLGSCSRGVSVVPGNHDTYVREAAAANLFERYFRHYLVSDDLEQGPQGDPYPFVKLFDEVALVGLSSAVPRPWFIATGRVEADQLDRAAQILADPEVERRFKVVMLHHPLVNEPYFPLHRFRRLLNEDQVRGVLSRGGVGLILTGHNHQRHATVLQGSRGLMQVRSAAAGSFLADHPDHRASYDIYTLNRSGIAHARHRAYCPGKGRFIEGQ